MCFEEYIAGDTSSSSIGWLARDACNPIRESSDTKECCALQSRLTAATTLIHNIKSRDLNFEDSTTAAKS